MCNLPIYNTEAADSEVLSILLNMIGIKKTVN